MEQNKNKTFLFIFGLLLMLFLAFAISGCVPPVPEIIEVTGVDIIEEDQSLRIGKTLQLTAIVAPEDADNKAIIWESDNPDVATVSENGLVTALKRGIANITVTTEDGAFTDTIKITVIRPTPVPSPTPTPEKYTLITTVLPADSGTATGDGEYEQGDEVSISATPADGYEFVKWTDDDDNNAVVSEDASYTFNMPGADVNYTANFISVYEVSFQIVDGTPEGVSSRQIDAINLSGFKIEIFTDAERNKKKIETETDNEGKASVKLPNGEYWFRVSKEGYATYPPEIADLSIQRPTTFGYFKVESADVTDIPPTLMVHVYTVTVADVVGGTATVTATPDTSVPFGATVTVNISGIESGKTFSSIEVVGNNSANPITTPEVTAGEEYTFTMPTEDVTVTVSLENAGCLQAGYIYNGSDYADDWMIRMITIDHTYSSIDGDTLIFKAFETEKSNKYYSIICGTSNKVYISGCINSIEIDWENTGSNSDTNESHLFVTTMAAEQYYDSNVYAVLSKNKQFDRRTDKLDVSGLNDAYYIQVQARVEGNYDDYNDESNITVYSIKLSEDMVVLE
jgi:uncharacterized repeat protein (TIGR02543 family)